MKLPRLTSFMSPPVEQVEASQYNGVAARTAPQPSEPAHWRQWWEAGKQVLPVYIAVRVAALIITCLAVLFTLHDFQWDSQPLSTLWHSWNRWDTIHFTTIATQGYADINNTAFFPLYSLLIRGAMFLGFSPLIAGLLISNAAGLLALIVLYQLVHEDFDHEHAWRTVLYISLFPTAFFLIAAYNETLFLCLSLLSFYAIRHGRWWQAGLFGLLACLTRSAGLCLLIPFGYEYLRQRQFQLTKLRIDSISMALIPAGIGIFALYCYLISGDALAFSHVQAHWQRHLALPWHGILSSIYFIRHSSGLLKGSSANNLMILVEENTF